MKRAAAIVASLLILACGVWTSLITAPVVGYMSESDEARVCYERGVACQEKGEYDLIITDFSEAIRLQPDYAQALSDRGAVYRKKSEYDQAVTDYTEAIRLKSDLAEASAA